MARLQLLIIITFLAILLAAPAVAADRLRLATTTSTENSGLLAELIPPFEQANNCQVDVIAVGTGKAIKLGENGDVDVILVHARAQEDAFVALGYGIKRVEVMYNDFVIVGPKEDLSGISGISEVALAFSKILLDRSTFISRGDLSGTHFKEKTIWESAQISPGGAWYLEAGRGMGDVLIMANEKRAYTLTDRGTYLAFADKIDLVVLASGDKRLLNPYGVIAVNPARYPHVNARLANLFINYLTSDQARRLINGFKVGGQQLFFAQ